MNEKSLFREMAKKVHPDMGMGSEFASGAKMREVIANKNNPHVLLNLARQWGLNLNGTFDGSAFDRKASDFARNVYETVVGAIIRHTVRYRRKVQTVRGVIVGIREITKGYRRGGREFKVYDFESNQIWTMKTVSKEPFDQIVGMADKSVVNQGKEKFDHSKRVQKSIAKSKQDLADMHFQRLGLKKNKSYDFKGVDVLIRYKGGSEEWEQLTRTTPKSAYIRCYGYKNNERRINIASILDTRYYRRN